MAKFFLNGICLCYALCLGFCDIATQVLTTSRSRSTPSGDEIHMLQSYMHSHTTIARQHPALHNDPEGATEEFNGVPIYGYDRINQDTVDMNTWMVMFPQSYTRNMLLQACSNLAAPSRCVYVGHPEQQGLPLITISSSETQLRTSVRSTCVADFNRMGLCAAKYIEVDAPMEIAVANFPRFSESQKPLHGMREVPWGLDRTNSRSGLDGDFTVGSTGKGIHIFLFDTGIVCNLPEFEGRAIPSFDMTTGKAIECDATDYTCAVDRNGHGTHTAGTVASRTYGIAKEAIVHSVKVLSDSGTGNWASFIAAVDWVGSFCKNNDIKRGIISASLGGKGPTKILREAIDSVTNQGISVVVAAGNQNSNACMYLPAAVKSAITVASVEYSEPWDIKSTFSNFGSCVDIFAPGTNITSLGLEPDSPPVISSGTSMAAPHVSGVVALLFQQDPSLTATTVEHTLAMTASKGCIKNLFPLGSTPNRLLYFGADENKRACRKQQVAHSADPISHRQ